MDGSTRTLRDRRRWLTTGSAALLALVLGAGRLGAADFVRGDANGDGKLSISDAIFIWNYRFRDRNAPDCEKAADFDDDGYVSVSDCISLQKFLTWGEGPPPAPFPGPGADPNPDELPCPSYGGGQPLADPAAEMRVLSATAPGGAVRRAMLAFTVSSRDALGGYQGRISLPDGLVVDAGGASGGKAENYLQDQTGLLAKMRILLAHSDGARIEFSYQRLFSDGDPDVPIPAGTGVAVLGIPLCLRPGTRAGEYPVTMEAAELADEATGRAVEPRLASGTLTVLEDVEEGECTSAFRRPDVEVEFKLGQGEASPGQTVSVPFTIRSSAGVWTYQVSVDFDEEVLVATGIELRWRFVDRDDFRYLYIGFDNHNEKPGSGGVDEGFFYAAVQPRLGPDENFIPPDSEVEALELQFQVKPGAPAGPSELRFLDRPMTVGDGPYGAENYINTIRGYSYTPRITSSFILTNGRVNIVPDATPFVRGDSNGDGIFDLSDAPFTLAYLFLAGERPGCLDAADANDDGAVDVADPITLLQHLFLGGNAPPSPFPAAGPDPTADPLGCARSPR
jgi:Dockerin type I domain